MPCLRASRCHLHRSRVGKKKFRVGRQKPRGVFGSESIGAYPISRISRVPGPRIDCRSSPFGNRRGGTDPQLKQCAWRGDEKTVIVELGWHDSWHVSWHVPEHVWHEFGMNVSLICACFGSLGTQEAPQSLQAPPSVPSLLCLPKTSLRPGTQQKLNTGTALNPKP